MSPPLRCDLLLFSNAVGQMREPGSSVAVTRIAMGSPEWVGTHPLGMLSTRNPVINHLIGLGWALATQFLWVHPKSKQWLGSR